MLARAPLAFPFDLDAGAIHCPAVVCLQTKRRDKQVEWALRAAIRNVHRKCLLALADGAGLRQVPIECRQPQEACYKARCLPKRHPEQHLHCQTGLDRSVTECPRPTPLDGRFGTPIHFGIEPDRQ
jgi:hypothetical protein